MHGAPALPADFTHMPYANPDAPKGGRLVWGMLGTFDSLNPLIVRGLAVQQIRGFVVESLMARGNDEPSRSTACWPRASRPTTRRSYVTFHLDPRARFSDGKPVTRRGRAVLLGTAARQGPPQPSPVLCQGRKGRGAGPAHRALRSSAGANDRELPLILGLMPVLPRHAVDPATFEETSMTGPIGSGPYRVTAVKPGASVTLTRNPDYWGRDLPVNRGSVEFRRDQARFLSRGQRPVRGLQARPLRFPRRDRAAALARRLRFSGRPQRRGDPRHHQDRPAAAVGISGVQHAAADVFRHPRAPGADAAVRFRMDQPQLLLRALCARRRASSPAPNCPPMAAPPTSASANC